MSINKILFKSIYNNSLKIIEESNDKFLKNKKAKLTRSYKKLCDENNHECQEFYSVVHELRTFDFLKRKRVNVKANNDNNAGPDFYSDDFGYIECISITKGEGKNKEYVDDVLSRDTNRSEAILTRITSCANDKIKKIDKYLKNKTIFNDKPILLAINASIFSNELHSDLVLEKFLSVFYGIGNPLFVFNKNRQKSDAKTEYHESIGEIKKNFSKNIELNLFAKEEFKIISGIIVINNSIGEEINDNYFKILVNKNAHIKVQSVIKNNFTYITQEDDDKFEWHNLELLNQK